MTDQIARSLSLSGGIRILVCSTAAVSREVCELQGASATASIALGRGLAGGALMGALLKQDQRVALKFEGNGPLVKMIIEADHDGAVRGTVGNPAAEAEPLNGKWNVPGILGRAGFLTVSKDLGMGGQPYLGMVQLRSSEIGDDLAYYLADSEQTPSAVGLGAALDSAGKVAVCGGFLVQALPGAQDEEIDRIMANIADLEPISDILKNGGPGLLTEKLWDGTAYAMLETKEIFFRCGCSLEKVEKALISLGRDELNDMADKEKHAAVSCEFCRKKYEFDQIGLENLINRLSAEGSR
jgi:molecular chaperone Hsp33